MVPISAQLVDGISRGGLTADGQHYVIRFSESDGRMISLGIPVTQLPVLVELCALAPTESARQGHDLEGKLLDSMCRFNVGFWKRARATDGGVNLALTLENGGVLAFAIQEHMATHMFIPRPAHQSPEESEVRGFGD